MLQPQSPKVRRKGVTVTDELIADKIKQFETKD